MMRSLKNLTIVMVISVSCSVCLAADSVDEALQAVLAVGPKGAGHAAAIRGSQTLSKVAPSELPRLLEGMNSAGTLSRNWLRSAIESVAERAESSGTAVPATKLTAFIEDAANAPHARRLAFEVLQGVDEKAAEAMIPGFANDASLELRRIAVAQLLDAAKAKEKSDAKDEAIQTFRTALNHARDVDQIDEATAALRKLGEEVDLPAHFGFVMKWNLIGPFDNREKSGFEVAYPPEKELNLEAKYEGQDEAVVAWKPHTTEDDYGLVDLNKVLEKHKGAIVYAYADFKASEAKDVDLRLGCINANKVWLNGQLLFTNNVYHANTYIDQYIGQGKLRPGKNTILIKVAQNEQTEPWAQRWQFQLRVCDQYGTAILPSP